MYSIQVSRMKIIWLWETDSFDLCSILAKPYFKDGRGREGVAE